MKITAEDIAKLFGVEVGEGFLMGQSACRVNCDGGIEVHNGYKWVAGENYPSYYVGKEITKLPWKPEYGDKYWVPVPDVHKAELNSWLDDGHDNWRKKHGLVFKTKEDAEAKWAELYGVEDTR